MVKGGDDSGGSRLPDVIERDRIVRPEPPPSLFHALMLPQEFDRLIFAYEPFTLILVLYG